MADTTNEVKDTTAMDTTANPNPEPAVPVSDKKEEKPEPTVQELMVEIAKLRREKDKNASEAAETLAPAMNLAAGSGGDLDTVSAGLVATLNGFNAPFKDAADYADIFATACNNSALDIDSLCNSMSVAAPVFSTAGYSVRDAATYLGVMANKGIDANKAANRVCCFIFDTFSSPISRILRKGLPNLG